MTNQNDSQAKSQAIAKTLKDAGFEAKAYSLGVSASLKRPVNADEVRYVLDNEFEGVGFTLQRDGKKVLVFL